MLIQSPAAIPHSIKVALWSRATFRAAVTLRLIAASSCNPACQERLDVTDAVLRAAVPMRFVTAR